MKLRRPSWQGELDRWDPGPRGDPGLQVRHLGEHIIPLAQHLFFGPRRHLGGLREGHRRDPEPGQVYHGLAGVADSAAKQQGLCPEANPPVCEGRACSLETGPGVRPVCTAPDPRVGPRIRGVR